MTQFLHMSDELTLQAYCDGELDAAAMAEFERRLATDADLRRRRDQIIALRGRLRDLSDETEPRDLATRIKSSVATPPSRTARWPVRAMAACLLVGLLAGSAATFVHTSSACGTVTEPRGSPSGRRAPPGRLMVYDEASGRRS